MKEKTRLRGLFVLLALTLIVSIVACYRFLYIDYKKFGDNKDLIINKNIEFTSFLPVVVIDTNGTSPIERTNIKATMNIYDNKAGENSIRKKSNVSEEIEIKARGRSSYNFPKKQYLIHIKENGVNKKVPIMGMPKESEWILNGDYADKSLIRNHLIYDMSGKIMDYAPRTRLCEVFVKTSKGEGVTKEDYKGLYVMIESIKMSENRIDLDKKMKNIDVTSYIIARNSSRGNDIVLDTFTADVNLGASIVLVYPRKNLTKGQLKYIENDVDIIEKRINSTLFNDPIHGYREYIDVDSFVDYVIINEFFYNIDAGKLSVYFHKNPGGKLKAGPVWDYNISIGNFKEAVNHKNLIMQNQPWFEKFLDDRYFVDKLAARYKVLRKTYLSDEYIFKTIDGYLNEMGEAVNRNFSVWGEVFNQYTWPNPENPRTKSHKEEIAKMKEFIKEHGKWLDEYFNSGAYREMIK